MVMYNTEVKFKNQSASLSRRVNVTSIVLRTAWLAVRVCCDGTFSLNVTAVDLAGNTFINASLASWSVDTQPPTVCQASALGSDVVTYQGVHFTNRSVMRLPLSAPNEPRAQFLLSIDGGSEFVWDASEVSLSVLDRPVSTRPALVRLILSESEFRMLPEMCRLKIVHLCSSGQLTRRRQALRSPVRRAPRVRSLWRWYPQMKLFRLCFSE